jgi:hypothetical protein
MGWYGDKVSRKEKIRRLTAGNARTKCIRYCYRGNAFKGILWQVWEFEDKFITCDILEYRQGYWYNKPLDESMHPYYYSCPLAYLAMTETVNKEWRESVKEYHAKAKRKRLLSKVQWDKTFIELAPSGKQAFDNFLNKVGL